MRRIRGYIAHLLNWLGFSPKHSQNVGGGLTAGYGELDDNGFWQYPLFDNKRIIRNVDNKGVDEE